MPESFRVRLPRIFARAIRSRSLTGSRRILTTAACAACAVVTLPLLAACTTDPSPDRAPVTLADVAADTLRFWPPRTYAMAGDLLVAEVRGLRRVYACASVDSVGLEVADASGIRTLRLTNRVIMPGRPDCPLASGVDTTLEAEAAGAWTILAHPDGRPADSLRLLTGTPANAPFLHSTGDSITVSGNYTFLDSTDARPTRMLIAQLETCQVLEAAAWRRTNTGHLSIRLRTIAVSPALPAAEFPPCAGPRTDTVTVHEDRYQYQ